MKKFIILIVSTIFLSGCWNYQELNNYAIVTGMAIDAKDDEYELSVLISNENKEKDSETNTTTVLTSKGKSIYEAMKHISLSSTKELYISHLSILILSEEIARKGVDDVIDLLLRNPQSHQNFYIISVKDAKAKEALSILTPLSDFPSQGIASNIQVTGKLQGRVTDSNFNHFVTNLLEQGINPVINSLEIVGDAKDGQDKEKQEKAKLSAYTKLNNIGIFKDDKLVDWATTNESIGINILLNEIKTLYLSIPCKGGDVTIATNSFKQKSEMKDDKVNVNAKAKGEIVEVTCDIDLEDEKTIKHIEKEAEEKMKKYAEEALELARKNETDIFGYGVLMHKTNPHKFHSINNWDEYFVTLPVDIKINFEITNKGSLEQTIKGFNYEK